MKSLFFVLASLMLVSVVVPVFAQENTIIIPTGALYPNSPYFWLDESTGNTNGEITIFVGDTITWKNEDSAFHTVTSVDSFGNIDGIFDSGFIRSGDSYSEKFTHPGIYHYFCDNNHPWMTGVIHVVDSNIQMIENVGSEFNEGKGYSVEYVLDVPLENTVLIDDKENTLTFKITKDTNRSQIIFILPEKLIENPNTVWVDGELVDVTSDITETKTRLIIPIENNSKEIIIMGSYVIPEFGFLTIGVLGLGIFSSLFLIRSKLFTPFS